MKSRMKRPMRRMNRKSARIRCCHGLVYTVTDKVLGATTDSADEILDRLRKIDGVRVVKVRCDLTDLQFPALRLPEVTKVLVPLNSAWAPAAMAIAAQRGRIW